jgi:HicB family
MVSSWHYHGAMELTEHVESIRRQFAAAAEAGGDEAKMQAERLFAPLESAIRLALQDALVVAAEEITCELAPGSVEVRLRGRETEFVVSLPQAEPSPPEVESSLSGLLPPDGEEGATARINLRLPEHLKARVDEAAASEGLSINSWLVRATSASLERTTSARRQDRRPPTGSQRYTGWSR